MGEMQGIWNYSKFFSGILPEHLQRRNNREITLLICPLQGKKPEKIRAIFMPFPEFLLII